MKTSEILIIDDNHTELLLLKMAYKDTGLLHPLITFSDSHAAYQYIAEHAHHILLILSDINMPVLSGTELLEKINSNEELSMLSIPFLFLSNSETLKDIEHAYALSAKGFFQKPFSVEGMTQMLKLIVEYWTTARIPNHQHHLSH